MKKLPTLEYQKQKQAQVQNKKSEKVISKVQHLNILAD